MSSRFILKAFTQALLLGGISSLMACAPNTGRVTPETRYVSIEKPASIPPGVVRYCWEEPIVAFEQEGPGLDVEGRWYSPAHVAVRQVRSGQWRPCRPMLSEVKGETKNER